MQTRLEMDKKTQEQVKCDNELHHMMETQHQKSVDLNKVTKTFRLLDESKEGQKNTLK